MFIPYEKHQPPLTQSVLEMLTDPKNLLPHSSQTGGGLLLEIPSAPVTGVKVSSVLG